LKGKLMEKKIAGLIGAVAALGAFGSAQASPAPVQDPTAVLKAASFAELLDPIPNAASLLQAVDEQAATSTEGNMQVAQIFIQGGGHHHHHHHSQYRRRYAPRVIVVPPRRYIRPHHHHHHSNYRRY
jgi:hypothetical protein